MISDLTSRMQRFYGEQLEMVAFILIAFKTVAM